MCVYIVTCVIFPKIQILIEEEDVKLDYLVMGEAELADIGDIVTSDGINEKDRHYHEFGRDMMDQLDINKELECPVCLIIPRTFPIFLCRAGHSVCCECFPRLPRNYRSRRCPICQAKYCNPPARNFIAEKLLEYIERHCRFDFKGCEFKTKNCVNLVDHEHNCSYRPSDFKLLRKHNIPTNNRHHTELYIVEILRSMLQLTVTILAILVVLFFLASLLSVLLGSMLSFARTVNSCKMTSECQLNDPNFIELWNDDLKCKFSKVLKSFNFVASFLSLISTFLEKFSSTTYNILKNVTRPHIDVSRCHPESQTSLYYEWPDTYLPSHLESLVWRPGGANVETGNFSLVWDVDKNIYIDDIGQKRVGFTQTTDRTLVKSFIQWKLDMGDMPLHCQIVAVEMWHGSVVLHYWDSPLLYASREILVMSTVTGWNLPECPQELDFGNITWMVNFNEEACRMKVDFIPEVNMESNYIY